LYEIVAETLAFVAFAFASARRVPATRRTTAPARQPRSRPEHTVLTTGS
jgi:hypothetical protein